MADVDITSLSVEISAESHGAELNINKLANAIANLRSKGNVSTVCDSLDKLAGSIAGLKSASKGIGSIFKNIEKMSNIDVSGIDFTGLSEKLESLKSELQPLQNLDASGLKAVGSAMNAIVKIPSINDKLDADTLNKFKTACDSISTSLTPLASQLDKVGNAFAKLPPQLSKVVTQANRVTAANEKQRKSYLSLSNQMNGFMRNMAKLVSLKAIADYLGNAVAKFNDFYEATDLFHNAMGNLSGEADTLISKMQGLLGVDPTKAMTYMATIQSLGTSFGLTSDKAYVLSKNLTQLAYDEGSYWNKDVAQTFTAMSSAISGEIEPIRRLGIDLSQARLQQELLALGFNKQVSSLSQADKAVLRYIAIMKQTANVQGNLAQTIQSPANQIKILKAQLDMLAKSVGSLLYPAMKSILPPLIAAVQLIREFVQWVAKLMGVKVVFTDFTKSADSVGGIGDAMDNTTDSTKKAAKALKDYTMGFDELNIIDPTQGSSGSGGGTSAGNILGDVDLSGYDMFKQYNEEFARQIDALKQKIKDMLPIIGAIASALALWKIVDFLTDVAIAISKMTDLKKLALSLATVVVEASLVFSFAKGYASSGNPLDLLGEVVSAAFGSFVLWRTMGADGITLGVGVAFVASLAGLTYALKTGSAKIDSASTWIQGILSTAFGSIAGITLLTNLGFGGAAAAAASISLAAIVTLAGITYGATKSGQLLEGSFTDKLLKTVMGAIGAALGAGAALLLGASLPVTGFAAGIGMTLAVIINKVAVKFGKSGNSVDAMSGVDAGINKIDAWFQEKVAGLKENWEKSLSSLGEAFDILRLNLDQASADLNDWFVDVGVWWNEKWNGFSTNFQKSWDSLPDYVRHPIKSLNEASDDLNDWFVSVGEWWNEKWEGFKTNFQTAWESLPGFVQHPIQALDQASAGLKQWFVGVGEWWNQKWAGFKENWDKAWNSLVDTIKNLPAKFLDYGKNIVQGLINGINNGIENAKKTVGGLAKAIIDKFTTETDINSPSKVFEQFGIYIDQGLANGIAAAVPYVATAMQGVVDAVQEKGQALIDAGSTQATGYVNNFLNSLDTEWQRIDQSLQLDFFGSINTLWKTISNGDLETLGKWAASFFYSSMDNEQKKQIKAIANNSLQWLTQGLSSVWNNIAGLASTFIGQLVPATTAATTAQAGLNVTMDANPILFVISLITMLVGALINFAKTNNSVASDFKKVWYGVEDAASYIFEGILRVVGLYVQGFIMLINGLIGAANKLPNVNIELIENPVWNFADKIASQRKARREEREKDNAYDYDKFNTDYSSEYKKIIEEQEKRNKELAEQLKELKNKSNYTGTNDWNNKNYGSTGGTGSSGSYNTSSGIDEEELRSAVYNGTYNAFLDIFQRYGDELTGGKEMKIYLDGKQITASIEKRQNARGQSLMGSEVYSY